MLRITSQQPMRRFNQKGQHFSGFLINPNTLKQDTGGVARHYQRYILDEAISAGVATVLSEDLNPYGPEAVDALRLRVSEFANGGCMGVIISRVTHDRLCQAGDIQQMELPSRPMAIGFGTTQDGTQEVVVGAVSRPGFLIDVILVVQDIAATLIGDDVFTDKGILLLKDIFDSLCVQHITEYVV